MGSDLKPLLIGYIVKAAEPRPETLNLGSAERICSVSICISGGPPIDWVNHPRNAANLFATPAAAIRAAGEKAERSRSDCLFAYRILPVTYGDEGEELPLEDDEIAAVTEAAATVEAMGEDFEFLGYDCPTYGAGLMYGHPCSPLSCNEMAGEIPTNRYCLLDTLEEAVATAKRFAIEEPEPGTPCIVEVWRRAL